ncbi:MAG TPA: acyl-CoA dehydrogenase [Acidimicrobiales bacterium]|nr:acyl-CoA dehydrogenase [Acidimicrobiales bacterium]
MRFSLTAEQSGFRDAVRTALAKECTPTDLRKAFESPGWRTRRWTTLAELGVTGIAVPEAHGGLGLGLVELVVVLEEAGRVALPEPLTATAAVVAPVLAELAASPGDAGDAGAGGAGPRSRLDGIAGGQEAAAIGLGPEREPVAGADGATVVVLGRPPEGDRAALYLLGTEDLEGEGGMVEPVRSLDPTRRLARVALPAGARPVATGARAAGILRRAALRAAIGTAAELVGLSDRLLTTAAAYAGERRQFGRPIGSFQAVKHLLAGPRVRLEFARPAVYAAAWALDEGEPDAPRRASAAKAQASELALEAARVALQVHGAIGYTWECDLHLFLKRAWVLAAAWGSAAAHRRLVLDSLLDERGLARP